MRPAQALWSASPARRYESMANDIMLFAELDLDMIGIGPYIQHPDTPLPYEISNAGNRAGARNRDFRR